MNYEDDLSWQIDKSPKAIASVIFAHGAGAPLHSDFIEKISQGLVERGVNVYRFNFPYMQQRLLDGKRRPPNRMPVLIDSFMQRIDSYQNDLPLFVMGKSMGSRVAASVSGHDKVTAVIALGYPFHPAKKPETTRLEPLLALTKPMLIVQGSRDALGSESDIVDYQLPEQIQVSFLEDGDHDLKPRVKSGFTHGQHMQTAIDNMLAFIQQHQSVSN